MKKLISVIAAVVMAVSMCAASMSVAYAAPSPQTVPTTKAVHTNFTVNGVVSVEIKYTEGSTNVNQVTFTYTGSGKLIGWTTNLSALGFVEGTDYTITYGEDGSMTIAFLSTGAVDAWNNNRVNVNANVAEQTTDAEEPTEEEIGDEEDVKETSKNESSKSPNTGAPSALAAGSIAVLGAGVAVLAATKKKDAE